MSAADVITVSVVVAADPRTAFELFTEETDLWWKRGPAFRFRPDEDGVIRFEPGEGGRLVADFADGDSFEVGEILSWRPYHGLSLRWRGPNFEADQETRVDVTFEAVSIGTRVTIEHSGWSSLPEDHPVRHGLGAREFYGQWGDLWMRQMRALRAIASQRARP